MPVSSHSLRPIVRVATAFSAAALVASLAVLAQAVPAPSASPQPVAGAPIDFQQVAQARFDNMKQRLQLTPEQEAQIKPILAENARKRGELRDKYQGQAAEPEKRMQMRQEMQAIRKDTDDRIAKVLTPAQLEQWTKMREETRQQMRQQALDRQGAGQPAPPEPPRK